MRKGNLTRGYLVLRGAQRLKQRAEKLAAVFQGPARILWNEDQTPHPFGCAQGRLCRTKRDKGGAPTATLAQLKNADYFFCQVIPPSALLQISLLLVESTICGGRAGVLPGWISPCRVVPCRSPCRLMFVTSDLSCWPFVEGCTRTQVKPPSTEWKSVPVCPPVHISWPWFA